MMKEKWAMEVFQQTVEYTKYFIDHPEVPADDSMWRITTGMDCEVLDVLSRSRDTMPPATRDALKLPRGATYADGVRAWETGPKETVA